MYLFIGSLCRKFMIKGNKYYYVYNICVLFNFYDFSTNTGAFWRLLKTGGGLILPLPVRIPFSYNKYKQKSDFQYLGII